jgi:hypothetical protein
LSNIYSITPPLISGVPVTSISVDSIFDFSTRMATTASPDWITYQLLPFFIAFAPAGTSETRSCMCVDPAHTELEPKTWIVQSRGGENAPVKALSNRLILPQVVQDPGE